MITFGHNADLGKIDGLRVLGPDPSSWGSLIPKAEYLTQFGPIKAWEIYILPHQLRPLALEQLAEVISQLSRHRLLADLDWLSFHFPTQPQVHQASAEISQERWRPFYQLLQVLDRFSTAKQRTLNFHIVAQATLPQVWRYQKRGTLTAQLKQKQTEAKELVAEAVRLRNHFNPHLQLAVENNPPYDSQAHAFHMAGLFPQELQTWQDQGLGVCLDIQHASLVQWYRELYSYDGPIPIMNELHHRSTIAQYLDLKPLYLHVAGAPKTPESFHLGSTIGAPDDDIAWTDWLTEPHSSKKEWPVIIELADGHRPENWPACQASLVYLKRFWRS